MKRLSILLIAACAIVSTVVAEEGGSGHYLPGAMASFVDGVPPRQTFIARYNMVFYNGDIAANEPLPIAGVTGDSGTGATLGDFKARTAGLGPVLSYAFKLGKVDMIAEAKWLHEYETRKRLEGDTIWFKFVMKF